MGICILKISFLLFFLLSAIAPPPLLFAPFRVMALVVGRTFPILDDDCRSSPGGVICISRSTRELVKLCVLYVFNTDL